MPLDYAEQFTTLNNLLGLLTDTKSTGGPVPLGIIEDIVAAIVSAFNSTFGGIWNGIKTTVTSVSDAVKKGFSTAIDGVSMSLGGAVSYVKAVLADKIEAVKTAVTGVPNAVKLALGGTISAVSTWIDNAVTAIGTKIGNTVDSVLTWVNNARDTVTTFVNTNVNRVATWVSNAKDNVTTYVNTNVNRVATWLGNTETAIKTKVDGVVTAVSQSVNGVGDAISNAIDRLIAGLGGLATNIGNAIGDKIRDIVSGISDGIKTLLDGIKQRLGEIIAGITDNVKLTIKAVQDGITSFGNNVKTSIETVVNATRDYLVTEYNKVATWITEAIGKIKEGYEAVKTAITNAYESAREYIGEKIRAAIEFLKKVWEDFAKWAQEQGVKIGNWIGSHIAPLVDGAINLNNDITGKVKPIFDKLTSGEYSSLDDFLGDIFGIFGAKDMGKGIYGIMMSVARMQAVFQAQFAGIAISAQKHALIGLAMEPVGISDMAQAMFRDAATMEDFKRNAYLSGVTQDKAKSVMEANRALPTPGAIQEAFLRGEIKEKQHDELLMSYGYTKDNVDLFKSLYWLIPQPQDLIRMAVREVFSPEIAERFGQFEDFPKPFVEWSKQIGLSEQWAKNYWAAHWDLPSPQMGFEMLHRGVIDNSELTLLLRALDVMPYWRERLIKISYNPLTRVDVRRMYQFGVIDESQVKKAYLDLGYDEEKASWLTEFTKRYATPEDGSELSDFKALARATYSQAYKRKLINREEYQKFLTDMKYYKDDIELLITLDDYAIQQSDKLFEVSDYRKEYRKLILNAYDRGLLDAYTLKGMLLDLGYSESDTVLEISLSDYNRQLTLRNMLTERLHDQYVSFIIDGVRLNELFGVFEYSSDEQSKLVEEWNIERSFRTKQPSIAELKSFLNSGVIVLEEFLNELRGLGYNEKYVGWYQQVYSS